MLLSKSNNNEWNSINNVNLNSRIYSCTLGLKIARSANFVHNKPFVSISSWTKYTIISFTN